MATKTVEFVLPGDITHALENWTEALRVGAPPPVRNALQKECQELGLHPTWGVVPCRKLHLTSRTLNVQKIHVGCQSTITTEVVMVDLEGNLWVMVHSGYGQDAPGMYARCGKMEDPGPLLPLRMVDSLLKVVAGDCCGYGSCSHEEVWGDPDERRKAREQLVREILADE